MMATFLGGLYCLSVRWGIQALGGKIIDAVWSMLSFIFFEVALSLNSGLESRFGTEVWVRSQFGHHFLRESFPDLRDEVRSPTSYCTEHLACMHLPILSLQT